MFSFTTPQRLYPLIVFHIFFSYFYLVLLLSSALFSCQSPPLPVYYHPVIFSASVISFILVSFHLSILPFFFLFFPLSPCQTATSVHPHPLKPATLRRFYYLLFLHIFLSSFPSTLLLPFSPSASRQPGSSILIIALITAVFLSPPPSPKCGSTQCSIRKI